MSEQQTEPQPRTWPHTVKLQHTVEYAGEHVASLTFRRGRAGDMKGLKLTPNNLASDDLLLIASRMCAQPVALLELLDIDDVGEVVDVAMDFYVAYLRTGGKR